MNWQEHLHGIPGLHNTLASKLLFLILLVIDMSLHKMTQDASFMNNGKGMKKMFYAIYFDLNLWLDVQLQYVLWLWYLYSFCLPLICPETTEPSCSNEVSGSFSQYMLICFQGLACNSDCSWQAEGTAVPLKPCTPKWDFWEQRGWVIWGLYRWDGASNQCLIDPPGKVLRRNSNRYSSQYVKRILLNDLQP